MNSILYKLCKRLRNVFPHIQIILAIFNITFKFILIAVLQEDIEVVKMEKFHVETTSPTSEFCLYLDRNLLCS